jgi:hypothetical protein
MFIYSIWLIASLINFKWIVHDMLLNVLFLMCFGGKFFIVIYQMFRIKLLKNRMKKAKEIEKI